MIDNFKFHTFVKFKRFLLEHKAFMQFFRNVHCEEKSSLPFWVRCFPHRLPNTSYIDIISDKDFPNSEFINQAFHWSEAPEGRNFWADLENKWNGF